MSARRSITTICSAFFVAALLARSPTVYAQTQASAQAAQAAFQRGIAAMDAHHYQAALLAMEESYQLYPSPVALYNVALAHREMGHTQQAIASFDRYLTEGSTRVPAERIATVRDVIRQLREQLVTLRLRISTASFTVTIDGRDVTLSDGAITVDPGDHVLVVTSAGHAAWREELHLAPGQQSSRSVTLVPEAVSPPASTALTPRPIVVATPHPREEQRSASVTSRWWFWTGLGALVAGGVIAGVVIANQNASLEPLVTGTAFNVQTIRSR